MLRWNIGDVSIVRVVEMLPMEAAKRLFPSATDERIDAHWSWIYPHFVDEAHNLRLSIHALVVESRGRRILVDTCVGNDKERAYPGMGRLRTPFLEQLDGAGYPAGSIDTVLCTHLHFDHVGWNTTLIDGRWVPTFERARYLFSHREWEYWREQEARGAEAVFDSWRVLSDSVRPVVDAGLVDLVSSDHRLTDEVWLEPTPGHTPGHVSVRISSRGQDAVITGDLVHNPVQFGEPTWNGHADSDGDEAIATRLGFLRRYGGTGTLVVGTHFPAPTAGRIVAEGDSWRFETGAEP
jgi:glyoxylase-like metal-dependent hydrolase (beta-lactamase superfamily II)